MDRLLLKVTLLCGLAGICLGQCEELVDCSGHGVCLANQTKPEDPLCRCQEEWRTYPVGHEYECNQNPWCQDADVDCSGFGECTDDGSECDCDDGYATTKCQAYGHIICKTHEGEAMCRYKIDISNGNEMALAIVVGVIAALCLCAFGIITCVTTSRQAVESTHEPNCHHKPELIIN